jgi:hypothetical protein
MYVNGGTDRCMGGCYDCYKQRGLSLVGSKCFPYNLYVVLYAQDANESWKRLIPVTH